MKYEYKAVSMSADRLDSIDQLNAMGAHGWELVAVAHRPGPNASGVFVHYFKRPLEAA